MDELHLVDFDGTVVDDMPALAALATYVMSKYFGEAPDRARANYFVTAGLPFLEQLELMGYGSHPSLEDAVMAYEPAKVMVTIGSPPTAWFKRAYPFDGVFKIISSSKSRLIRLWWEEWQAGPCPTTYGRKIDTLNSHLTHERLTTFYGDTDYDRFITPAHVQFVRVK